MKKKFIGILICFMIISTIPIATGKILDENELKFKPKDEPSSIFGITIMAGYLLNPTESPTGRITANAVALLYYDRGIIKKDAGILTGLRKVSFKNNDFLFLSEQDSLGLVKVFGICTGFRLGF